MPRGVKRKPNQKPTPKQATFIRIFTEAIVKNQPFILEELLLKAGYAPATARQQMNTMAGIKPHIAGTIDWIEKHRAQVQKRMDATVGRADYGQLARAFANLTKAGQLLGGRPTETLALSADDRKRLDALIENL